MSKNILDSFNLSYSTYSVYKESQLLFYFQKISGLQGTDWVPSVYGDLGNNLHDGMEGRIKDKNFNAENLFIERWYSQNIDNKKGIFNTKPKQQVYLDMISIGVKYIDNMREKYDKIIPELKFLFKFHGVMIKGFIDVVAYKNNDVYLFDWKSDSTSNYEKHFLQRLFYSWAYWKVYGIIPKNTKWVYLRKLNYQENSFNFGDMQVFEEQLKKDIDDIKQKGTNISNYEIGNIDTPFNQYKTLAIKEKERRKDKLRFGIATYGNFSYLVGDVSKLLQQGLDGKLSYEKKDAEFIQRNSDWDGVVHLYDVRRNMFPTGYIYLVKYVLKQYSEYMKKDYTLEYKEMRTKTTTITTPDKLKDITLRSYQEEAVEAFMKSKYGVVKAKTGLGKTILATEIIRRVALKTLWVINRKLLVTQTKEVFEELLGKEIGTITEGEIDIKDITICTYQTLTKRFGELSSYLKDVGLLVIDECHNASGKSIKDIANKCLNTEYRLGLSATPDTDFDKWFEVRGVIGNICYKMAQDDERNKEFLSDCEINFIELDDKMYADSGEYAECYQGYIVNNQIRNDVIERIVIENSDKKILIITKSIDHGVLLSESLGCPLLIGETSNEDRDKITAGYKSDKPFVCVASYQIVSEGYDIPQLDIVIQAAAMSSAIKTIQGIGRGLRKAKGKDKAFYFDFVDKHQKFFRQASRNRMKALEYEGHKINKVKENE